MNSTKFVSNTSWDKFCQQLWFNRELDLWLDISQMKLTFDNIKSLEAKFNKAFEAINALEQGAIANVDEHRQVGHYWLRDYNLCPNKSVAKHIQSEISRIEQFASDILRKNITSSSNKGFTDIVWIGIGGSALGPQLIVDALSQPSDQIKFHFIDNVDPIGISQCLLSISKRVDQALFVVVSKSGSTPEPRLAMEECRKLVESHNLIWGNQCIAITMQNSHLDNQASRENWLARFDLPDWVGGRTSITGAVGLLPAALLGHNINEFLLGAKIMDKATRSTDIYNNPSALLAASWWFSGNGSGKRDMVVIPYADKLSLLSRYLQQLVMESLGKKMDRNSVQVNQGLSVYGNKGSTDQHAYIQQLRDGLDNFFATFIEVLTNPGDSIINIDPTISDHLSGFLQGTRRALSEGDKQSITITLKGFDIKRLGSLIALFERTVSIYGELINVNAYHQPGVEHGKKAAVDIISLQGQIASLISTEKEIDLKKLVELSGEESIDKVFYVVRYITADSTKYTVNGDWGQPSTLTFKKK